MCSEPAPPPQNKYSWEKIGKWFNENAKLTGKIVTESYRTSLTWVGETTQKTIKEFKIETEPFKIQVREAANKSKKYIKEKAIPNIILAWDKTHDARKWVADTTKPTISWVSQTTQKTIKEFNIETEPFKIQVKEAANKSKIYIKEKAIPNIILAWDKTQDAGKWVADTTKPTISWVSEKAKKAEIYLGEKVKPATKWMDEKTKPPRKWIDEKIIGKSDNTAEKVSLNPAI